MQSITRRRFLWLLGGAAGLAGFAAWRQAGEGTASPATSSTTSPVPSTSSTRAAVATTPPPPVSTTTSTLPIIGLDVIARAGWGAREPAGEFRAHEIRTLTVHHTAVELADDHQAPARLRGHQSFHQQQGWPDVAYHFAIDRAGNVYQGRPVEAAGDTFTNYDPYGHFLPVLEGDYNTQSPTELQLESLVLLLAWAVQEYSVDPSTIAGHRDYAATTCPGDSVYEVIADGTLATRVRASVESGRVSVRFLSDAESIERVAAIESA